MRRKDTLHRIRLGLLIAVLVVFGIYIINKFLLYNQFDTSYPEILFEQDVLEISVAATKEDLLAGVTATDKKDGDVTASVIIESMSNLLEGNERIVTYAAFDGDNHVGKAEHRVKYTDYKPIRFSLTEPINVSNISASTETILAPLRATDCIDGDISDQIVIADSTMSSLSSDAISVIYEVQVTNSAGEVANLALPLKVNMSGTNNFSNYGEILLKEYLVYVKAGESVDYASYIEKATFRREEISADNVKIDSNLDTSKAGVYTATYSITQEEESVTCDLIIVVEE